MSKLLNKPFKWFTIYALLILVSSIPVYYYVVESIWFEELDDKNWTVVQRMELGLQKTNPNQQEFQKTLVAWNSLQPETKLIPLNNNKVQPTRAYTTKVYNPFEEEMDRFRVLSTTIRIQEKPYLLTVSTNVEEADETLLAIAFVTAVFFIVLVLGFVFLNKRIARNSWKPFYKTLNELKQFDLTKNQGIRFERSDIEEFEELNRELKILIEKNRSAFNQQKTFIENASHELQTPLALLKTKMDILLQNKQLTEDQSIAIASINSNLSRISRINKNLLLLAKIENNQFAEKTRIPIAKALHETLELLEDYRKTKGMRVQMDVEDYHVDCNFTLLEVLFNNLLTNAIRHGQENDVLLIRLEKNKLTFSNSGIHALNSEQLFLRFGISSSETTNSGLGLAISKEICDRYHWKLSYLFNDQLHQFTIEF